jgi:hypothetical protein
LAAFWFLKNGRDLSPRKKGFDFAQWNEVSKMTIVAAAIKVDDQVFSVPAPGRHADVRLKAMNDGSVAVLMFRAVYGFFTDEGVFLNRQQALDHTIRVGQPLLCRTPHALGLYSEDLW